MGSLRRKSNINGIYALFKKNAESLTQDFVFFLFGTCLVDSASVTTGVARALSNWILIFISEEKLPKLKNSPSKMSVVFLLSFILTNNHGIFAKLYSPKKHIFNKMVILIQQAIKLT